MKPTVKSCDKLWTKAVKKRANGKCEVCGKDKGVQAHHIIPRTNYALRFDLENGVALCIRHHLYWAHKDPIDFLNWVKDKRNLVYLENNRHRKSKNDYYAIQLFLENEISNTDSNV